VPTGKFALAGLTPARSSISFTALVQSIFSPPSRRSPLRRPSRFWRRVAGLKMLCKMLSSTFCDDFGMRKLPLTAAEDLLEIIMRRYERASTLLTSNRPVEDWGKLLGDVAAVTAMLDRLLHHGHVLKCGPRSWRTKTSAEPTGSNQ